MIVACRSGRQGGNRVATVSLLVEADFVGEAGEPRVTLQDVETGIHLESGELERAITAGLRQPAQAQHLDDLPPARPDRVAVQALGRDLPPPPSLDRVVQPLTNNVVFDAIAFVLVPLWFLVVLPLAALISDPAD